MNVTDQVEEIPPITITMTFYFFKTMNRWHILSNASLKDLEMIICYFPFTLLIWRVALIALRVLNSLAVGINSADPSILIYFGFGVAVSL